MNVFKNRPLSLILCIILGGLSLCFIKSNVIFAVILFVSALALILFVFHPLLRKRIILKVCAVAFIIASLAFRLYFGLIFYPIIENDEKYDITAEIDEVKENSENLKTLTVYISSINGEDTLKYKSMVYIYNSNCDFKSGNTIFFSGKIQRLDFESDTYNIADGISSFVYASDVEIIKQGEPSLTSRLTNLRESIKEYTESVTDNKSASLLNALLLGERDELDAKTSLDFKRSGITHILALSGMHLAILSTALTFLLKRFGINKRVSIVVTMVFVVLFVALVGFPSSVVRAGVMLLISSLVYLLTGCKDNLTSLLLAFVLILTVQPYLIYDVSLWLSVLSTLGILVCQEYVGTKYDPGFKVSKLFLGIKTSLLFSLFAIATTYAIAVVFFDSSSLLAPIATLFVGFMANLYVYFGLLVLVLGALIPIGNLLKYLRIAIEATVSAFSSFELASFSVSHPFIKVLGVSLTLLILAFFIVKVKYKKLAVALVSFLYLFVNVFGIALCLDAKSEATVKYQSYGNEVMIITGNDSAYFVDFGESNSGTSYINASYAYNENICVIDYYYLLNYSETSVESIENLASKIKIKNLCVPHPSNSKETELLEKLYTYIGQCYSDINLFDKNEEQSLSGFELLLITESECGYNPKTLSFVLAYGAKMYGYTSLSALEISKLAESLFYTCDGVIVGDYGDSLSVKYELDLSSDRLKFAIISSENTLVKSGKAKAYYEKEAEITP